MKASIGPLVRRPSVADEARKTHDELDARSRGGPVSDVDRAKAFYAEQLGFNVDHDTKISEGNRIVQLTPPGSGCSIVVGDGIVPDMALGSLGGLQPVVLESTRRVLSS